MKRKILIIAIICLLLSNALFTGAITVYAAPTLDSSKISAVSAILIDEASGQVIFEKNSHERRPIASVTKIMTMDIIMDALQSGKISLSDKVGVSTNAESTGGSQVWLKVGEHFTVDEMLKSIAVHSANDSCVAMAEFIAGSESDFVSKMNDKVAELGLQDTKFVDSNGLSDDEEYSTAYDVSVMARDLIKNHPDIIKYTSIINDTFRNGAMKLNNTNLLLKSYKGMYGIKTGTTDKAGNCLAAGVERDDMNLISVVLGAPTADQRFSDTKTILDFGFNNFEKADLASKDNVAGQVDVKKTLHGKSDVFYKDNLSILVEKGQGKNIKKPDINLDSNLTAPVTDGQKVGEAVFRDKDNKEIARMDLVIKGGKPRVTYFEVLWALFDKWLFGK